MVNAGNGGESIGILPFDCCRCYHHGNGYRWRVFSPLHCRAQWASMGDPYHLSTLSALSLGMHFLRQEDKGRIETKYAGEHCRF